MEAEPANIIAGAKTITILVDTFKLAHQSLLK